MLPDIDSALRWAFSQPVDVIIAGMSSIEHVETDVAIAENFVPLSPEQWEAAVEEVRHLAKAQNLYWRNK